MNVGLQNKKINSPGNSKAVYILYEHIPHPGSHTCLFFLITTKHSLFLICSFFLLILWDLVFNISILLFCVLQSSEKKNL